MKLALFLLLILNDPISKNESSMLLPAVAQYAEQRIGEFDQISEERQSELKTLAAYVRDKVEAGEPVKLTFICTHNSRRSHLSQVWAQVAAAHYRVPNVITFSGGTEATAFNPRAVAALQRAGLSVDTDQPGEANPQYQVSYATAAPPLLCFSKVFSTAPNPQADYCAVMTCSQADDACPIVHGCEKRIAIRYEDPKVSDGTKQETAVYDERCRQIAREMLFLMSAVAN
jgi:arsenate reductase